MNALMIKFPFGNHNTGKFLSHCSIIFRVILENINVKQVSTSWTSYELPPCFLYDIFNFP